MDSQTTRPHHRFGFLGAGKLAGSVMRGLVRSKFCAPSDIMAGEPHEPTGSALHKELGITVSTDNAEVTRNADILFLGVKPIVVLPILKDISPLTTDRLIISLAAGVRLESMEGATSARLMRAMTNTPSAICRAATALARGSRTTEADFEMAKQIFRAIGAVVEVNDAQIDAVTALSGSGPAFVYTVIEALADGGVAMGLSKDVALTLATQTVLGASQLATETKNHPKNYGEWW